ncbi:hypothetical protein ABIA33_004990 [Streptacidiphilus sp. MAP12-16]
MEASDERLYVVTTDGSLACVDAGETAISDAQDGRVPHTADIKATG